jgi:hypothetical protein
MPPPVQHPSDSAPPRRIPEGPIFRWAAKRRVADAFRSAEGRSEVRRTKRLNCPPVRSQRSHRRIIAGGRPHSSPESGDILAAPIHRPVAHPQSNVQTTDTRVPHSCAALSRRGMGYAPADLQFNDRSEGARLHPCHKKHRVADAFRSAEGQSEVRRTKRLTCFLLRSDRTSQDRRVPQACPKSPHVGCPFTRRFHRARVGYGLPPRV